MRRIGIFLFSLACVIPTISRSVSASALSHSEATISTETESETPSIGSLSIPRLKLTSPIYLGVSYEQFEIGVGEWPGSPKPGKLGNIVLGGHRTAGPRPFANIHKLKSGDVIYLVKNGKSFRYKVTKSLVVSKTAIWITKPTPVSTLTLFSCHPVGKTSHRYVIRAIYSPK
jgi:sortase A